jgi:hypothetical protein
LLYGLQKACWKAVEEQQERTDASEAVTTMPFRIADRRVGHIFRNARGHLRDDTPENRALLEGANNPEAQKGTDHFGNTWAADNLPDGTQVWTQSREDGIINGGLNATPQSFDGLIGVAQLSGQITGVTMKSKLDETAAYQALCFLRL